MNRTLAIKVFCIVSLFSQLYAMEDNEHQLSLYRQDRLAVAIFNYDVADVLKAINEGADVNQPIVLQSKKMTPLEAICSNEGSDNRDNMLAKKEKIVRALLKAGAAVTETALFKALNYYPQFATALARYGANVDAKDKDDKPLLITVVNSCKPEISLICSLGADIQAVDKEGNTALFWVVSDFKNGYMRKCLKIIKLITAGQFWPNRKWREDEPIIKPEHTELILCSKAANGHSLLSKEIYGICAFELLKQMHNKENVIRFLAWHMKYFSAKQLAELMLLFPRCIFTFALQDLHAVSPVAGGKSPQEKAADKISSAFEYVKEQLLNEHIKGLQVLFAMKNNKGMTAQEISGDSRFSKLFSLDAVGLKKEYGGKVLAAMLAQLTANDLPKGQSL